MTTCLVISDKDDINTLHSLMEKYKIIYFYGEDTINKNILIQHLTTKIETQKNIIYISDQESTLTIHKIFQKINQNKHYYQNEEPTILINTIKYIPNIIYKFPGCLIINFIK